LEGDHRPPNVVLISIDTLRAKSLRAYNEAASEHHTLDGLGARGLVFERAYSTASWTLPAHASLFTGLYSDRHGAVGSKYSIANVPSFVETLRSNGYQTVGFTDGVYLDAHFGFSRGFENYDGWADPASSLRPETLPRDGEYNYDTKALVFDRAKAFLQAREDHRPLFLFVQTYAVHDYFREWLPGEGDEQHRPTPRALKSISCLVGKTSCTTKEWRQLEADYESAVADVDTALSELIDVVNRRLGVDRTYIVLLSDHGEGFDYPRGRIHHGGRLHRDLLHVPLLLSGPEIESGRTDEIVSLVDVGDSLLELVGLPQIGDTDGRSFAPLLTRSSTLAPREAVWAHEYFHYWHEGERLNALQLSTKPLSTAWIDPRYWYIADGNGLELYAAEDQRQVNPIPEVLLGLPTRSLRVFEVEPASSHVEEQKVTDQLRALGYIR
jgi:arylsulfatase A-like enzyme